MACQSTNASSIQIEISMTQENYAPIDEVAKN
jgi:hypothetical protein